MKNLLLVLGMISPIFGHAEDKFLTYHFNDKVDIIISNIQCKVPNIPREYQNAVVAKRNDGQFLFGCFTHKGDMIVIQWAGGDRTELPANAFLIGQ